MTVFRYKIVYRVVHWSARPGCGILSAMKIAIAATLALARPFYAALTVQCLWNWFVSGAIHASEIGYGRAFGMFLLAYAASNVVTHHFEDKDSWEMTRIVIDACVPDDRKSGIAESIKRKTENPSPASSQILSPIIACSLALAAGWIVHALLL